MKLFCIWGETRADVLDGYDTVSKLDEPPQRITWRLVGAFDGSPVGDACFAPNHPDIRAAYADDELEIEVEVVPQVEEAAVYEDGEE